MMKKALLVWGFIGGLVATAGLAARAAQDDALVFIAHPDWHAGDLELGLVQPSNGTFEIEEAILEDMKPFGAKYILLSGDLIDGLWLPDTGEGRTGEILARKARLRDRFAPGADDNELVRALCEVVYGGLNRRFRRFGLEPIAAIGDHEVGDQNWTRGSPRANAVPAFKQAFARAYTLDAQGRSRYDGRIGRVPQRPVGTQYEDTCYAFVDRNVLFVTVDLYRFEGVDKTLDPVSGVLSVEMAPEVRHWLEALLSEVAGMEQVEFTVVQAHHPLIQPVRKIQTSGILINDRERSAFWQLLRRYRVDVYFSGEVHALTPQIDPESQVAHIVCGSFLGNTAHNYIVGRATDGRLELLVREKAGDGSDYVYETTGSMVIHKSGGRKRIETSGRLTPLDLKRELFDYRFDQADLAGGIVNHGQFGDRLYHGVGHNVRLAAGVRGSALALGEDGVGYFETRGKEPFDYDMPRTVSVWLKTTQGGRGTVCSMGHTDYCVVMDGGVPAVRAHGRELRARPAAPLNDGRWHHLAWVYPGDGATLKAVRCYVDGVPVAVELTGADTAIHTGFGRPLRVGALAGRVPDAYRGLLDELRIWAAALTAEQVRDLYRQARPEPVGGRADRPNFLFIAIDDLNTFVGANRERDDSFFRSIYPDPAVRAAVAARLTPHIDRLAAQGRQFVNAMCQSPLCGPSRTALLTGVPTHVSGYYLHSRNFRTYPALADAVTLPQYLKQNGYFTAGLGKIFHSPNVKALTAAGDWPDSRFSWDTWISAGGGAGLGRAKLPPMSPRQSNMKFGASTLTTRETTDWQNAHFTRELLETGRATRLDSFTKKQVTVELPDDKPFFLASGIFRPHLPFFAPQEYFDRFPTSEMGIDQALFDRVVADIEDLPEAGKKWTQLTGGKFYEVISQGRKVGGEAGRLEAWKQCVQAYLACVAFADACVGEILTGLANSRYRDNTIVILWSDHGYFLGNKARIAKQCLWREALNCNLIVRMPGQRHPGAVSQAYVMLTDLYPTVVALGGLARPEGIMGMDISAQIRDPHASLAREYLYSTYMEGNHAVYSRDWKYIRYHNGDRELYDLRRDPSERENLAGRPDFASQVQALDARLNRQLELAR